MLLSTLMLQSICNNSSLCRSTKYTKVCRNKADFVRILQEKYKCPNKRLRPTKYADLVAKNRRVRKENRREEMPMVQRKERRLNEKAIGDRPTTKRLRVKRVTRAINQSAVATCSKSVYLKRVAKSTR